MKQWRTLDTEAGIYTAPYPFGGNEINTTVVAIGEGKLLVIGPGTTTSDAAFDELDGLGEVVAIASPGPYHHLGIPGWKARYPEARLFATRSGIERIPRQHRGVELEFETVDALANLLPDHIVVEETPAKHADLHLMIRHGEGAWTWVTNEIIINWADWPSSKLLTLAFKLFGVRKGLDINGMVMKLIGAKKGPTGEFFRRSLDAHPPTRLIPSHGAIYEGDDLGRRLREVIDRKL